MTWNTTARALLDADAPLLFRQLVWVSGLTRFSDGATVSYGVWSGLDDAQLTVSGESRLYYGGAGGVVVAPVRFRRGTEIYSQMVRLTINPETENLVRGHRTFNAPVELHVAMYEPSNMGLVDIKRFFKGFINGTPLVTPGQGGQSTLSVEMLSQARKGTMSNAGYKSNESQLLRDDADGFRTYGDLGEVPSDPWGAKA